MYAGQEEQAAKNDMDEKATEDLWNRELDIPVHKEIFDTIEAFILEKGRNGRPAWGSRAMIYPLLFDEDKTVRIKGMMCWLTLGGLPSDSSGSLINNKLASSDASWAVVVRELVFHPNFFDIPEALEFQKDIVNKWKHPPVECGWSSPPRQLEAPKSFGEKQLEAMRKQIIDLIGTADAFAQSGDTHLNSHRVAQEFKENLQTSDAALREKITGLRAILHPTNEEATIVDVVITLPETYCPPVIPSGNAEGAATATTPVQTITTQAAGYNKMQRVDEAHDVTTTRNNG